MAWFLCVYGINSPSALSKSPNITRKKGATDIWRVYKNHEPVILLSPIAVQYRKMHWLRSEFHVKIHVKNRYRTSREAMSAISVFQVNYDEELTCQAVNFASIEYLKINSITGRNQRFCTFVSRASAQTMKSLSKSAAQILIANREQNTFRMRTTFIPTLWRKQGSIFYSLQRKK